MKDAVSFDDFVRLDIRIGRIVSAEKVEGADKLIRLRVDLGDYTRQIIAGMAEFFPPSHLEGKLVPVLVNLAPRTFRGLASEGMILAADVAGRPVLLHPESDVPPGSVVR